MSTSTEMRQVIGGLIVLALLLASCGGPSRLESLELDPMAAPTLEFGEVYSSAGFEGSDSNIGLTPPASVTTRFVVDIDREVEAIEELARQAGEAGWEMEAVDGSTHYSGTKSLDGLGTSISIKSISRYGPDGIDAETASVSVIVSTSNSHP